MAVRAVLLAFALTAFACGPIARTTNPELSGAARSRDIVAMYEALETMVDDAMDGEADRLYAWKQTKRIKDDGSAANALARAAIIGRYAEVKGLKALWLLKEIERLALESIERDAAYNGASARRMLGSLYVLAGDHTEHGDSEEGLELLEDLVDEYPEDPLNQLRLAEGYIILGDPDPAFDFLCGAQEKRQRLRPSDVRLLDRLFSDVGGVEEAGCAGDA
jgi:hypothetical protein